MEKRQEQLYSLGETSEITDIEKETLRKYTETFNIQTKWTKEDNKGHRRYTKENVELLIKIKEKIKDQNWSWKQVSGWLNGEEDYFLEHQEKSNLEKKMDLILEDNKLMKEKYENQEKFFLSIIKKMEEKNQNEMKEVQNYIDDKLEKRDQLLLEVIDKKQEEKRNKSFFKKIFSSKKKYG